MKLRISGYTLVEILTVLGVIGILAAGAYVAVEHASKDSETAKLRHDVETVNQAIRLYQSSGGSFTGVTDASTLLAKLKTKATNRVELAGLRGNMVDPRLMIVMSQEGDDGPFATYNPDTFTFNVEEEAHSGIKKFALSDDAVPVALGTEARTAAYALANPDAANPEFERWVWKFSPSESLSGTGPINRPAIHGDSKGPSSPLATQLTPPIFTPAPPQPALAVYPLTVMIGPPRGEQWDTIWKYAEETSYHAYTGPITVNPGSHLQAKRISLEPESYLDSEIALADYVPVPVVLAMSDVSPSKVSYASLGGALMPGSQAPPLVDPVALTLTNASEIPPAYQNSSQFRIHWTLDGSSPKTSNTRIDGITFSNGYPGEFIPLSLASFTSSDEMNLRYYAGSLDPAITTDSEITSRQIVIEKHPLNAPQISPASGIVAVDATVTLSLDLSSGVTPVGARIFYRTDGGDPGDDGRGAPLPGAALWTGSPFTVTPGANAPAIVVARVYGPDGTGKWFTTSAPSTHSYAFAPLADAPTFNPPPPVGSLAVYPVAVSLVNPNDPTATELHYHTSQPPSTDVVYTGPIVTPPGVTITAITRTTNPLVYRDSLPTVATYVPGDVQIVLSDTLPGSYTYAQLGGQMAPGSPAVAPVTPGKIQLANGPSIPDDLETNANFQIYWTLNGSDPLTSPTRITGTSFTGGYPGDTIPVGLLQFGNGNSLSVKYVGDSTGAVPYITDSVVTTKTVAVNATELPPPLFTPASGGNPSSGITLSLDVASGKIPVDARIYYRADNVDPGDTNGEPNAGAIQFTGTPILITGTQTIQARCYPPTGYKNWFTTSIPASATYNQPVLPNYFASNGTPTLYRFDAATGDVAIISFGGLFNIASIAYDSASNVLYYTENASSNFRLARYDVGTGVHTLLGSLTTPASGTWDYVPTATLTSLSYFAGSLYYVCNGTDDLVRITLSGSTISNQVKIADISHGVKNFGTVGDLTTTADGRLWIAGEDELATFQLTTLSGYTTKRTYTPPAVGTPYYTAMLRTSADALYSARTASPLIYAFSATGAESSSVSSNPATNFNDFAATEASIVLPGVTTPVYAVNGTNHTIYQINPANGLHQKLDDTAPFNLGAIAFDSANGAIYYLEAPGGSTWRVGKYLLATGTHLLLGDLKVTGTNLPTTYPNNLVFYNASLYYLHPNSSNLVKVILDDVDDTVAEQINFPLGTSVHTVGDLVLDNSGVLYWDDTNGSSHSLYKYNLRTSSSLSLVGSVPRSFPGLGFVGSTLYGTGGNGVNIDTISTSSGTSTQVAKTQPDQVFTDFASGSTAAPPSGTATFYSIRSTDKYLYRLDPITGRSTKLSSAAPFNMAAIAFDEQSNLVYYLEKASSNWRIGRFNPVTNTHTVLGSHLGNTATGWKVPTTQPNHMVFYAGQLLFIENNTGDLRRIEFDNSNITGINTFATLNGGASQGAVNAAAIADDGTLFFASSSVMASYNLKTKSGYNVLATNPANSWQALVFTGSGALYGINSAVAYFTYNVSTLNGDGTFVAATSSLRTFIDIAGPSPSGVPDPTGPTEILAVAASAKSLLRVNPDTGTTFSLTDTALFQPTTVAYDKTGGIIYYAGGDSAGEYRLARYTLATSRHAELGSLVAPSTYAYTPSARAENLIYFRDGLYYVAPNSDDLVKIVVGGTVITSQTKVRDLTANAMSWPSIGGLASTSLGVTYFGGVSADFFGRFLLPDGTGFANLSTAAPRTYAGLVTRASDQAMYAVRPASVTGDAGLVSHTVAPLSGALTFKATYANPTALLDLADAVVESASLPTLYAVSGTNTSIYKFDHLNGNSLEWLSDAPFQIESIAVTPDGSHVYYVEKAASGWRLGDYDSSTNLHTIRGALSNPALDYVISSQPQNLMYQNGRLYFIAEGTDDLVAVEFTDTGSPTIRKVVKVADVNGNVALTNIGDIAADSTGVMYISASNAFATWNFASQSGFTVRNATPADYWAGLVVKGTELYGVSHLQPGKLYHVDKTTGNGTYIADYNPAASFIDFAAPQPNIAMDAGGQTYFITTSSPNIDRLDLTNGQQYDVTSQVPLLPTGIALDHAGGVVYTVGNPVSGTGILLAKYDLSTGLNTTLGSLTAAGLSYVPAETPHNLAFFNGNLYYLAAHTDDLVKIVLSGNTVAAQTKVWDVGVPNYLWETLAIGPDSSAYLSTSEAHYLARINIAQQAGPVVIKSSKGADEGADYVALTFDAAGQMHGTVSHQNVKGYQVNPVTGATAYHWDGVRYGGSGVPILDTTSPYSNAPISVGDQFATDGTTSIFRVNPVNGAVTLLTNEGLFPMQALAYDASSRVLYYTENISPNWRLAKYDLASNTHTLLGNLDEPTVANAWNFNPTARPTSLSYFSGNLYYIHNNSDDLIRIDLSNGGIANQTLVADITNGVKNFGVVGDLTTTSDGRLWIAAENELATFQLTTLSNYTLLRTTTSAQPGAEAYYPGLQSDIWNGIYADRQGVDTGIYKLNATGAETSMVATTPSTSLIDYAGAESSPPLPQVTNNLFAVNGTKSIFRVNPANAQNVVIDRTAPYNLQALAYDAVTNSLFYLEESTSATWRIGCYHLTSGLHSSVLGDLKLIGTNKPTISPSSLVFYNQALYYLHPNSANLVKVSLNLAMDTILDQTNIPLGTSFQTIGDLALDDTGLLYWVNTNGASHTLYRYDLRNNTGLVSMGAASAAYPALAFFGGTLYGTGGNGFALDSLNTGSGVGTLVAQTQPNQTFQDFAAASTAPAPVSADFYAIGAGAKTIYRLDPATGANVPINNTAPYNLGALALDGTHRALLYLEETTAAAATWSLGRYDLTTKTHTALGDIKAAVNAFSPTAVPHNLTYYNGALYLIVPGHDDLIKIQLNAAGTAVTSISRAAILTGGALVFDAPGDLACNNAGLLYFTNAPSSGSPMLYRYDLIGAGGFGIVGNTAQVDLALGFSGDQLYAAAPAAGTFVDRLSTLTASITGTTATSPPLAFTDFAGPSTDTPPSGSDAMWAVVPYVSGFSGSTDPHLVKFTNYQNSGGNVDRIDYGILAYQNGGTVTSFAGNPSSIEAMTVDAGQQLYFVRSAATVVAGITYERPLFVLNLNNLSGSSVANFVGDLGPSLRTESGISPLTSNEVVSGLAVGADGKLRLVLRKDTGAVTDVLMRVESLTPNASGALSVTLLGPLQNGATSAGNAKGLAIDSTGQAYVTDADDLGVYKVNATTGVLTLPMYSTEGSGGPVAVHLSDADVVTALPNRTISKVVAGNANDPAYFHTLNLWGLDAPTAIAFPGLAITPPAAVNGYFAASGTASIYRLDPLSGANIVATTAPFAVQSVAFDQAANRLYYVEAATSNWRLGRYDVASNTHSLYNFTLQTPGGVNQTPLTNQPENLFIANGGLYTIPPNTDDVVKIDLTPTGIDSIHKITDLNNEVSQGNVTAASIDNVGNLYLASTAVLAKFNLPVMGGYTTVASNPNIPWSGLVMNGANNLYGIRSDDPYKTFSINPTSGATTYAAPILPRVAFTDITFASGPYLPSSGYAFASTTSSPSIHRVDLATAKDYVMTWQAKANVEAVAYDQVNGLVYYLDTGDSPIRIHAYNLLTDAHTTLRDASFQTDLKQIGTNRPTGAHPHHLVHFNGALYYIATGTDDLFRITFTSPLVIADQVKVADIAGNAAVGNVVGAFTVDDNGIAYLSYEDADVLARFDMRTLGGFTVISNTALTARYHAMTYDSSTLFGVPYSAPDNLKLFQLAVANGNRTLVGSVNPSLQLLDLSTSTPTQPALPAPTSNFFAITGGNKNLYRLDPTTGQNVLLNNTAAYNLGAIAYDLVSGNIYYLEDGADATWNMGKYNVSTSTHAASLGNIKTISGVATAYPGNLVFYNNALYYIQPGSSKLTKAQLDGAASAILSQTTLDLGTVFNSVGDLALDDAGVLYWVSTNGSTTTLYKYDLRNQTGFAAVATTTRAYPALGFLSNTCYGSGANAYVIDSINPTTATTSIASTAQPNLVFADFAAPSSAAIPAPPVWAIGENGNAQLLRINGYDGAPTLENFGDIRYPGPSAILTAFPADSDIESFAVTADGFAYFVRNKDTTVNGATYGRPLFRMDLNGVSVGNVQATFLGDLDQALSVMNGAAINTTSNLEGVSALAVGSDGALYGVYQRGTDSVVDKLFKLTSLSVDGAGNLAGVVAVGNITNGTSLGTQVDALEFHSNGTLYAFDTKDGEMLVLNPATAAVTGVHSVEAGTTIKEITISPLTNDFIAANVTDKSIKRVNASGPDTALFSYQASPPWGTPSFSDMVGLKFPARNFNPANVPPPNVVYACTGGNKDIYSLDLTTGATAKVVDNAAAFNLNALAYDPVQNTVFYLQDTPSGYALGSWQLATNTHSIIYDLTVNNDYNSVQPPSNLTWWGGYLWFIEPGTDDLVRITTSPTAATQQIKMRDITANTVIFSTIGDLAVDDSGVMYFTSIVAGNSRLARMNMLTLSSYTNINTQTGSADYCPTLVFGPDAGSGRPLYGTRDTARSILRTINTVNGVISTTSTATTPSVAMIDTSDRHLFALPPLGTYYAVAGGTDRSIYAVNPETGTSTLLTTAPASFAGVSAIAWDQTGGYLYYLEEASSNFKLGRYSLDTGIHVSLGSLQGSFFYNPTSKPGNLGFLRGSVYYIASGTDDLVRIDVSDTAVLNEVKISDLNSNVSLGNVGDLVASNYYTAYFTANNQLWSFSTGSMSSASPVATFTQGTPDALAVRTDGTGFYGTFNPAIAPAASTEIYKISTAGAVSTNVSTGLTTFRDFASPDISRPDDYSGYFFIGGSFGLTNTSYRGIARLNRNTGALDYSFNAADGPNAGGTVTNILPVENGTVLGSGSFSSFEGQPATGIIKLRPDGSVDQTFRPIFR